MSNNEAQVLIEAIYLQVKTQAGIKLKSEDINVLVELLTELANRLKVEEDCGE